ncbi:MAG: two-component system, OmpR family, sensor kinase [Actinomycetota bacterium]|nr:two-component system, OmpR family, sensor kinase [Actinomycetota bacterium]
MAIATGSTNRLPGSKWSIRALRLLRRDWVDIAWVVFVGLNLIAMQLLPHWQTVPFLVIWVSLTAIYGLRLRRLGSTILTVLAVTVATGGLIGLQVLRGQQDVDYLAEVPLIAMMFALMVWHARRRAVALEETKQMSERNLRLLDQQRRFLQDASHELSTPITVALGHAQLIERSTSDPSVAQDAHIAVDELLRLRRLADRLLLLASAEQEFLYMAPVELTDVVVDAARRWSDTPRLWKLGVMEEATIEGDADRLIMALDALIENAVEHTEVGDSIELSVHRETTQAVISVADTGSGIAAPETELIFDRFTRVDMSRNRKLGGFGLGLAIVKTIAQAHKGSVRVRSSKGKGSVFEVLLPLSGGQPTIRMSATPERTRGAARKVSLK